MVVVVGGVPYTDGGRPGRRGPPSQRGPAAAARARTGDAGAPRRPATQGDGAFAEAAALVSESVVRSDPARLKEAQAR